MPIGCHACQSSYCSRCVSGWGESTATTFFDNLFPTLRLFAWLDVVFKTMFLCTLNGKFKYGGAAAAIEQPDANQSDRKIETLREQPPKVTHVPGTPVTIGSAFNFDSGKMRLASTERPNLHAFVARLTRKRTWLVAVEKFSSSRARITTPKK